MALFDWLRYSNQGATRSQPLSPKLVQALSFLPELGMGFEVFSGGQPSSGPNRVGSHRHDLGHAGDGFFTQGGRRLDWRNPADRPLIQTAVSRARANGVTGVGAGEGYMQPGSVHIGFGTPAVWGRGGSSANAPAWLRSAFGSAGASASAGAVAQSDPDLGAVLARGIVQEPGIPEINALAERSARGLYGGGGGGGSDERDNDPRLIQQDRRQETPAVSLLETEQVGGPEQLAQALPLRGGLEDLAPLAELFKVKTIGQAGKQPVPPVRRF